MTRPALVILIDSLPWHLTAERWLFSWLSVRGPMIPGIGYSYTQKDEVLAGTKPDDLGYLNEWQLKGRRSVRLPPILAALGRVRDHWPFGDKVAHYCLARLKHEVLNVPWELIGAFRRVSPRSYDPSPGSIFSDGEWQQIIGDYDRPLDDAGVLRRAVEVIEAAESPPRLFLSLAQLDEVGHTCGPDNRRYHEHAAVLSAELELLAKAFRRRHRHGVVAVFSDHGMLSVDRSVHLPGGLFDLAGGRRAAYWLDSTMLRVWCDTDEETERLGQRLAAVPELHLLSQEERARFGISSTQFGSLIALTHPGIVFLPNHFGIRMPKGMHGYHPDVKAHWALYGWAGAREEYEKGRVLDSVRFHEELKRLIAA